MPAPKTGDILNSPPATDAVKKAAADKAAADKAAADKAAADKAAADKAAADNGGDDTGKKEDPKPNKDGKIPGTVLSFEEVQAINRKYPREVVTSNNRKKK